MTQDLKSGPPALSYPSRGTSGPALRKAWFPLFCFLIILVSTTMQIGCLKNGLVIDDNSLVFYPEERGCGNNPIDCFSGKLFGLYYRPVLTASFAVVQKYHIHNNDAIWFHIENLVLHAIVVALALWLFRLVLRRRIAALLAGVLFALHPVQVCVTTFVGGRTDTLALLFVFLFTIGIKQAASLFRAAEFCLSEPRPRRSQLCGLAWIVISLLSFLAAVFTKEQVIPLLFITPLLVVPVNTASWRNRRGGAAPLWLAIYIIPILAYAIAGSRVLKSDTLPPTDWSIGLHVEMVGRTLWYFAKTLFAPTITTLHQSTLGPWDTPQYLVAALGFLSAAVWLAIVMRVWSNKPQRFMALWATLTLASCINLIPIPSQFASPYRAAIPLFGFAGLFGSVLTDPRLYARLGKVFGQKRAMVLAFAIIPAMGWCIVTSMRDVPNWHDELALMKAEVAADPNYVQARAALANDWSQPPTGYRPNNQRSLQEYNICIDQLFGVGASPDRFVAMIRSKRMIRTLASASDVRWMPAAYIPQILRGRGSVFQSLFRYEDAIQDYSVVHELMPQDIPTRNGLAYCLHTVGDRLMEDHSFSDAAESYKAALQISPDDQDIRAALISAYRIIGRKDRADAVERMEDRFTGKVP